MSMMQSLEFSEEVNQRSRENLSQRGDLTQKVAPRKKRSTENVFYGGKTPARRASGAPDTMQSQISNRLVNQAERNGDQTSRSYKKGGQSLDYTQYLRRAGGPPAPVSPQPTSPKEKQITFGSAHKDWQHSEQRKEDYQSMPRLPLRQSPDIQKELMKGIEDPIAKMKRRLANRSSSIISLPDDIQRNPRAKNLSAMVIPEDDNDKFVDGFGRTIPIKD